MQDEGAPTRAMPVVVKPPAPVEIPAGAALYRYDTIKGFEARLRAVLTESL